jgi:homoserine acetyltransferase
MPELYLDGLWAQARLISGLLGR